ncbi:hypothetical protein BDY17DRAFT_86733 [Neohortaea acidophila]|uniref:Uncharacterized protein n=1 Tax=Neohortaea acidophila TaxID=245834 RepID=A0A6A6Q4B7_9PEZI|nr:uncharacterized protein BDY17DRAFT_86733 [Neohortaea acidophila]KAF2486824.1 hypothetical protein BDY17DRAFT_86733 [Neohortaea acidophila]
MGEVLGGLDWCKRSCPVLARASPWRYGSSLPASSIRSSPLDERVLRPPTHSRLDFVCVCVRVYDFSSRRSLHPFNQLAHVPCVRAHSPPRPLDTQPQSRRVSQPRPLTPPDTHATRVTLFFSAGPSTELLCLRFPFSCCLSTVFLENLGLAIHWKRDSRIFFGS